MCTLEKWFWGTDVFKFKVIKQEDTEGLTFLFVVGHQPFLYKRK